MQRLTTLVVLIIALSGVGLRASVDSCLVELRSHLTITEKILLDVTDRWPDRTEIDGDERERLLRFAGYADSTNAVSGKILAEVLAACTDPVEGIELRLVRIRGIEGTKDESVFLVLRRGQDLVARTLLAALQATCDNTFLRACTMLDDLSIRVEQLRHDFDCANDEFLSTEVLSGLTVRVRANGEINERVDGEEDQQPSEPTADD